MRSHVMLGFGALCLVAFSWAASESQDKQAIQPAQKATYPQIRQILEKHCFMCHGPQKQEGPLKISALDPDLIKGADAEHWQEVLDRLNAGTMPPKGKSKLSDAERAALTSWLTEELKRAGEARRSTGGRTILRRLTRYEYSNTLRDLLGIDLDFAKDLPPEAAAELGFQNNSKVLVTSFLHLDHFQKIAKRALVEAMGSKTKPVPVELVIEPKDKAPAPKKAKKIGNLKSAIPPNTEGSRRFGAIPNEGSMLVRVTAWASPSKTGDAPTMQIGLGLALKKGNSFGRLVAQAEVDAPEKSPRTYEFPLRAENFNLNRNQGNHLSIRNHFDAGTSNLTTADFPVLHVTKVELFAPYHKTWPPESRTRIMIESKNKDDEKAYARDVIEAFMRRAYRRPVTADEVTRMHNLFVKLRASSPTFDEALTDTLSAVLVSPGFLLLAEPRPSKDASDKKGKVTDYELASRLSYFLWSTMPDDTLFALAKRGKLQDTDVLRGQVKRMLEDPNSKQFSERFVSQWLDLESVNRVAVNPEYFPSFDNGLKPLMRQETMRFFDTVLREDLTCFTLLDSDFAVLNARLAKHYGIPGVAGDAFRKVALKPEHHRGGVLTHASILLGNSSGDDTHPVKRGVWVLERLLNDPPPPPPPEVPTLAQQDKKGERLSLKDKLFAHRQEAACMNCHKKIDPWGLAFENYDAVGIFQNTGRVAPGPGAKVDPKNPPKKKGPKTPVPKSSGKTPGRDVDSDTELPDGTKIDGLDDLKKYLLTKKRDRFAETIVSKMLSYAVWRNLEFSDRPAVQELSAAFRGNDYRLRALITDIVLSDTFRTK